MGFLEVVGEKIMGGQGKKVYQPSIYPIKALTKGKKKPSFTLGELNREVSRLKRDGKEPEGSGVGYTDGCRYAPELFFYTSHAKNA